MDFFPLFGGSRVEKTGKGNPVASSQVLKLLSSSLKIVPPYRLRFIGAEWRCQKEASAMLSCKVVCCPVFPPH